MVEFLKVAVNVAWFVAFATFVQQNETLLIHELIYADERRQGVDDEYAGPGLRYRTVSRGFFDHDLLEGEQVIDLAGLTIVEAPSEAAQDDDLEPLRRSTLRGFADHGHVWDDEGMAHAGGLDIASRYV